MIEAALALGARRRREPAGPVRGAPCEEANPSADLWTREDESPGAERTAEGGEPEVSGFEAQPHTVRRHENHALTEGLRHQAEHLLPRLLAPSARHAQRRRALRVLDLERAQVAVCVGRKTHGHAEGSVCVDAVLAARPEAVGRQVRALVGASPVVTAAVVAALAVVALVVDKVVSPALGRCVERLAGVDGRGGGEAIRFEDVELGAREAVPPDGVAITARRRGGG